MIKSKAANCFGPAPKSSDGEPGYVFSYARSLLLFVLNAFQIWLLGVCPKTPFKAREYLNAAAARTRENFKYLTAKLFQNDP
jgi:hypothetical protein